MGYEQQTYATETQNPLIDRFEQAHDLKELVGLYEQAMTLTTASYDSQSSTLVTNHEAEVSSGQAELSEVLEDSTRKTEDAFYITQESVVTVADAMAHVAPRFLSAKDAAVFEKAKDDIDDYGLDYVMANSLRDASSKAARNAMKAGLDSFVLQKARSDAASLGLSYTEENTLRDASSVTSRNAIKAEIRTHKIQEADLAAEALRRAREKQKQEEEEARKRKEEEEERARQEAEKLSALDKERISIVDQAIARDKGVVWLQSTSPKEVQKVINTVRAVRASAEADGEKITDLEIYRRYRRRADQAGSDPAKAGNIQAYNIMDALMGGYKGKLPF